MSETLTIRRPDDWHVHLRDGDMLRAVVGHTARQFARAIVMPNLAPPVTDVAGAVAYRERIMAALPEGADFTPLMTCYLTDATDPDVDVFDREAVFIDRVLIPLVRDFPNLKIVLEHITTEEAAHFVRDASPDIGATITPQHLHLNRNALFAGGLRPHAYCLPVVKREKHRLAVRAAAVSGSPKFFLGTDSAPHPRHAKESGCGCAGIFNAPYALESYAAVFEEEGALDKLEGFASEHGARFYGLPLNEGTVTLQRTDNDVPDRLGLGDIDLVPFHAGQTLNWAFAD